MNISKTILETREIVKKWHQEGLSVGLVPTMGYLHEGHGSLIEKCKQENDKVVVSIFVNPTQFAPNEDFESYPRDLLKDSLFCEKLGADLIFNPDPSEMYHDEKAFVNITGLSDHLCGKTRPIHFKGVCTVVLKLFNIVNPDKAYFGQKDAQQLAIIKKMVKDLDVDVTVIGCPIVREADGLAKSSRNIYLSEEERKSALCLSQAIKTGKKIIREGQSAEELIHSMKEVINEQPLAKIDYLEVVDNETILPVDTIQNNVLIAMAVYIGKTRLIDNFIWEN